MKSIKYRSWHKEEKIMGKVTNIELASDGSGEIKELEVFLGDGIEKPYLTEDESKYFELMQYTGLKDKNDVEIYEGDILKTHQKYKDQDNFEVVFENGMFNLKGFYNIVLDYPMIAFGEGTDYLEVIGNIYENKELLK